MTFTDEQIEHAAQALYYASSPGRRPWAQAYNQGAWRARVRAVIATLTNDATQAASAPSRSMTGPVWTDDEVHEYAASVADEIAHKCGLDGYQRAAMHYALPECRDLANAALGLTGEAGEVAEHVKKHLFMGRVLDKDKCADELGDVLWYVALACQTLGLVLSDVAAGNISKLRARYPNGFVPGGGVR